VAGRQPHAPLKAALRELHAVNDGGAQFTRQRTYAVDDEIVAVDSRLDAVGIDAGQRHQHEHRLLGLQNVDRRLP